MGAKRIPERWIRPIVSASATLGLLQSVTWIILAILGISTYVGLISVNTDTDTSYVALIYQIFLQDHGHWIITHPEQFYITVNPAVFVGFLWFYLLISLVWLFASIMFPKMAKNNTSKGKYVFWSWAGLTIVIIISDIILTGLLSTDSKTMRQFLRDYGADPEFTHRMMGTYEILVALAARGYFLLILNCLTAAGTLILGVAGFSDKPSPSSLFIGGLIVGVLFFTAIVTILLSFLCMISNQGNQL